MKDESLQSQIKECETELLNLKQIQGGLANVACYMYSISLDGSGIYYVNPLYYRITYKPSKGSLISSVDGGLFQPTLLDIEGNTQIMLAPEFGTTVYITSSWEIEKIEKIV